MSFKPIKIDPVMELLRVARFVQACAVRNEDSRYEIDLSVINEKVLSLISISSTDLNECEQGTSYCHQKASCTNTRGSYNCTCNQLEGYIGDGFICYKYAASKFSLYFMSLASLV